MPTAPAAAKTVAFGKHQLEMGGKYIGEMRESNNLLDDPAALRARLDDDGYLLIRGLHDREAVMKARRQMFEKLAALQTFAPGAPLMDGVINPASDKDSNFWDIVSDLTESPAFQQVVSHGPIMDFFTRFLGGPSLTFDFKWLRLVGKGQATGAHIDVVYMGRGTSNLYTCWTPLGDIPLEMGPLAVCVGSHREPGFARMRETYGKMDVDRDHVQGWFSEDPKEIVDHFGGRWATTSFQAGDLLIFGMFTMHASLVNISDRYRLSCDTRYQPASEAVDERWVGEKPIAHYGWNEPGKNVDMAVARQQWGV